MATQKPRRTNKQMVFVSLPLIDQVRVRFEEHEKIHNCPPEKIFLNATEFKEYSDMMLSEQGYAVYMGNGKFFFRGAEVLLVE